MFMRVNSKCAHHLRPPLRGPNERRRLRGDLGPGAAESLGDSLDSTWARYSGFVTDELALRSERTGVGKPSSLAMKTRA